MELMLGTATDLCPHVLNPESRSLVELRNIARAKARIPPEFVSNLVQVMIRLTMIMVIMMQPRPGDAGPGGGQQGERDQPHPG